MMFSMEQRRLTVLGLAAVLSGLVGCSMFKEKATPKLSAEWFRQTARQNAVA